MKMKVETEGKQKGVPLHISRAVFGRKKKKYNMAARSKIEECTDFSTKY